jgi:hypothetical protein
MQALIIKDKLRWHDKWSSDIGQKLDVKDSTNDMFIFDQKYSREDILAVLEAVPQDMYQILEVTEAPEEDCHYMGDSGQCFRRFD